MKLLFRQSLLPAIASVFLSGCGGGDSSTAVNGNSATLSVGDSFFMASASSQTVTIYTKTVNTTAPTIAFSLTPYTTYAGNSSMVKPVLTNADCAIKTSVNGLTTCSVQIDAPSYYGQAEVFKLSAVVTSGAVSLAVSSNMTVNDASQGLQNSFTITPESKTVKPSVNATAACNVNGKLSLNNIAAGPSTSISIDSTDETLSAYGMAYPVFTTNNVKDMNGNVTSVVNSFTVPSIPVGVTLPSTGVHFRYNCTIQDDLSKVVGSGVITITPPIIDPFAVTVSGVSVVGTSGSATITPSVYDPSASSTGKYYEWKLTSSPVDATMPCGLLCGNSPTFYFNAADFGNVVGDYHFQLKAARSLQEFTDPSFPSSQMTNFIVRIVSTTANDVIVSAGNAQSGVTGSVITLSANASGLGAASGMPMTYQWSSASPSIVLSNASTQTPTFIATAAGTYDFTVVATATLADGSTVSNSASTRVIVTDSLTGSVSTITVYAGDAQIVTLGASGNLTTPVVAKATATLTGNYVGKVVQWSWSQTSGPTVLTLSNADTNQMSFSSAVQGTYLFTVTGTIASTGSDVFDTPDSAVVTVTVNP